MDFLQELDFLSGYDEVWTKVFVVVLATGVANLISSTIIIRIEKTLSATRNLWDDALLYALRKPISLSIWAVGLAIAAEVAYEGDTENSLFGIIHPARDVIIIFALAWFGLRFINSVEKNIFNAKDADLKIDKTTVGAISKILRVTVYITATLIAMQTLGFSISGVLAFGGIGGMAVGFAAKDMLSNFFGAMMIYFDKPFKVGDWIRSPDKEIEGTVADIGWRQTKIITFDKRPLYVPNAVFSTIAVQNPSRMTHRRINETIGIRYDDISKMKKITLEVEKMLKSHKEIDNTQTLMVNFNAFNNSSVDFFIYTFTKTTDWVKYHSVKQDVLLKIADIIENNGAEIAFPTRTLHLNEQAAPKKKVAKKKAA